MEKDYIDLGLPSGTLWKTENEDGYFNYDEAVSKFGSNLPTKKQLEELIKYCEWIRYDHGYKVVGSNGNSIFLSANGIKCCEGIFEFIGYHGNYWSSTPSGSYFAWYLFFVSCGEIKMCDFLRSSNQSVRLVKEGKQSKIISIWKKLINSCHSILNWQRKSIQVR